VKHLTTLQKWLTIGIAEIVLSLFLIAIAPIFLNSNKPLLGFAIWLFVPTLLSSSGIYVTVKIIDAQKARSLFIQHFSNYSYLKIDSFLGFSAVDIEQNLKLLEAVNNDPSFDDLGISLIDILKKEKEC
jgi:hypothetical protein